MPLGEICLRARKTSLLYLSASDYFLIVCEAKNASREGGRREDGEEGRGEVEVEHKERVCARDLLKSRRLVVRLAGIGLGHARLELRWALIGGQRTTGFHLVRVSRTESGKYTSERNRGELFEESCRKKQSSTTS